MRHRRNTLEKAIKIAGFKSGSAFARFLGINQTTVSGWLNGSINPSDQQARTAADALGWNGSLEKLFKMDGE